MTQQKIEEPGRCLKKRRAGRRIATVAAGVFVVIAVLALGMLAYNNVSLSSDKAFAKKIDGAIEKGIGWTKAKKGTILETPNTALIKMLKEADNIRQVTLFADIVNEFMSMPTRPKCWKRLLDPNWPVDDIELNITIEKEYLDNKWVLYAIAPDKAKVNPNGLGLFERDKWQRRKLTHQLDALLQLRKTMGPNNELDGLIRYLCERLSRQMVFDFAVVDIYIQKVTFILRAGFPQLVRRRWVERIVANQQADGGWNDRWFCFTSDTKRPVFDSRGQSSNQHATLQALTALYMVRYGCPEHFRIEAAPKPAASMN